MIKNKIYIRVSKKELNRENQILSIEQIFGIKREECEIFEDIMSGSKNLDGETWLNNLLKSLEKWDNIYIFAFDRLTRLGGFELLKVVKKIEKIWTLKSAKEPHMSQKMPFRDVFLCMQGEQAYEERKRLIERTNAGLKVAKAKGKKWGRKTVLNQETINAIKGLIESDFWNAKIAKVLKISISSVKKGRAKLVENGEIEAKRLFSKE
jgi:DNA invertase Pin-like site-specific DNA recombinase